MPFLRSTALAAQAAAAADVTTVIGVNELEEASGTAVSRVEVLPPVGYTTVTGTAAPNNAQITVRQLRAGSVIQANVAQLVLAVGTNLVAETPVNIPIINQVTVNADDVLDVVLHQNGTGLLINAGLLVVVDIG